MNERTTIDVIMVEPGKEARVMALDDNLEAMQKAVGGLIEPLALNLLVEQR